jgi:hypothetical protein
MPPPNINNLRPIQQELEEMSDLLDDCYEMSGALVEVRKVVEESSLNDEAKYALIERLNAIYRYLRTPIDAQLQDIGGRRN